MFLSLCEFPPHLQLFQIELCISSFKKSTSSYITKLKALLDHFANHEHLQCIRTILAANEVGEAPEHKLHVHPKAAMVVKDEDEECRSCVRLRTISANSEDDGL
jgi:hypothetical protein